MEMKILKEAVAYDACEWGVRDGLLLHITQVCSGISCNCRCPDCGDVLIAKKGEVNAHHFAHKNLEPSKHCGESLLHRAAKECVSQLNTIMTPGYTVEINAMDGVRVFTNPDHSEFIIKKAMVETARPTYRPDCTVYDEAMRPLDIEIKVSHKVDHEKRLKVTSEGVEMIEIDLSSQVGKPIARKELVDYIFSDAPRSWVYKASRLDYRLIVDLMVKAQREAETRTHRGWLRSYGKLLKNISRLEGQLAMRNRKILRDNMTDDEAVDALGQAALNRNG
jgi:hypothetical protein